MNRVLRLLRQGSRDELLKEALMLNRVLAVEAGSHLRRARPEAFGIWTALGELLSGAARSTSRAAVPSILRSTRGRGQEILELLAGESGPIPRSEIKRRLKLPESQLSHLLRNLEEVNLVIRYRPERSKEVLVDLGPTGREVVTQSVLPPWLVRLSNALEEIAAGSSFNSDTLARELQEAGAPSRLVADRLAAAIARLAPAAAYHGRLVTVENPNILLFKEEVTELTEDGVSPYQQMRTNEASLPARALFSTKHRSALAAS